MSLGRRVVISAELVLADDSAINTSESDYGAYREAFDWKHLKFHAGQQPTVFAIKPLTYRQRMASANMDNVIQSAEFVIRCGLDGVDGYLLQLEDGTRVDLEQPDKRKEGDLGELVTTAWLAKANLLSDHLFGIAGAINHLSEAKLPLS